jgi:hypothetical protein
LHQHSHATKLLGPPHPLLPPHPAPLSGADAPAQGAEYRPDPEEWFEERGQLIHEDDLAAIAGADRDGGAALLADEFSDFDDEDFKSAGAAPFDAGFSAGGAAEVEAPDDDF